MTENGSNARSVEDAVADCIDAGGASLDLTGMGLTQLPAEVLELTDLKSLNLESNQIVELPRDFERLSSLTTLFLDNNKLTLFPVEIYGLRQLKFLSLDENELSEVPSDIGTMAQLQTISLNRNKFSQFPLGVTSLSELFGLAIAGNDLTVLPEQIAKLTKLESFYCYQNALEMLPPEIGELQNLNRVMFWHNRLAAIPDEFWHLENLTRLDLSDNRLTEISPAIARLSKLEELEIDGNELTSLPAEIGQLPSLHKLDISRNLLPASYMDALGQSIDSFRALLASLNERTECLFEAKLLVTGEGKVGKSWALAALQGADPHEAVGDENTTWGIDRGELQVAHPGLDSKQITLNTWDFGGQEIYRVTHQFFFSPEAIYLLVWNPRVGAGPCRVREWLRTIALRTGGTPTDGVPLSNPTARVIMVATHARDEGGAYNPDYGRARLEPDLERMIVDEIAIDSERGYNVDALRAMIARHAAELPEMGQPVNQRWADARKAVLELREQSPWIDFDRFAAVCAEHDVYELAELKSLAWTYLHSLGRAVWYGDGPRAESPHADEVVLANTIVLDAVWLSRAFVQVLEDQPTRAAGGMLDHHRFAQIWTDHGRAGWLRYKPHEYEILKQVMRRFDVALPTRESEGHRSLVPQLVPADAPDLPWREAAQAPGARTIRLSCQLDYEAIGLAPRLIAATEPWHVYEKGVGLFWEGGVFLRDIASFRNEALIRITGTERPRIDVVVSGEQPAFLMQELFKVLESESVLAFWKGMTKSYSIGCPTQLEGGFCPGFFKFDLVIRRIRDKIKSPFNCDDCAQDWRAIELMSGFEALGERDSELSERYMLEHLFNHQQKLAPRLFLLESLETKLFRPTSWNGVIGHRFKITLLSEFSGKPVASREFTLAKNWVKWIGPITRLASLALTGAAVPLGGDLANQFTESAALLDKLSGLPEAEGGRSPFDGDRHGKISLGDEQLASFAKFLKAIDLDPRECGMGIARGPGGKWYWMSAKEVETYTPQAAA